MGIIEKMRLDGKKGFVTGAARGLEKARQRHLRKLARMWQSWIWTMKRRRRQPLNCQKRPEGK